MQWDHVTYTTLLRHHAVNGDEEELETVLARALQEREKLSQYAVGEGEEGGGQRRGVEGPRMLTVAAFTSVVALYAKKGDMDRMMAHYTTMQDMGIKVIL